MTDSPQFHLRWRGRTTGPYSLDLILRKLDEHEIGLWHEIGQEDHWTTLGEFLEQQQRESSSKSKPEISRQAGHSGALSAMPVAGNLRIDGARPSASVQSSAKPTASDLPVPKDFPSTKAGERRHRKLFVAMGLLAGFTGVHNFYAGYWGTALIQLMLSGVTWVLGFGIIISWIWALIELLVVNTDARGRPMN